MFCYDPHCCTRWIASPRNYPWDKSHDVLSRAYIKISKLCGKESRCCNRAFSSPWICSGKERDQPSECAGGILSRSYSRLGEERISTFDIFKCRAHCCAAALSFTSLVEITTTAQKMIRIHTIQYNPYCSSIKTLMGFFDSDFSVRSQKKIRLWMVDIRLRLSKKLTVYINSQNFWDHISHFLLWKILNLHI